MTYYHYINNGRGPKKLFIGGLHGNEGKTSFHFLKDLKKEDFSNGQIFIVNFDKSEYISTLKKNYYESAIGRKVISLIKTIKPDFYIELHCYNIKNFKKLTSKDRMNFDGVPPLIDIGDFILVSSVSPYIRLKYLQRETICKTLEFPCFDKLEDNIDMKKSINRYNDFIKLLSIAKSRKNFEKEVVAKYPNESNLAIKYTKEIFGSDFPIF
ncbi:MAG: DUF2119 domain-containing protein [Methanobacteriaceae archaeon]|jgi:hypothetical protein|nr:DUF2119 domain-containing protein [Methanobacteriaceae archaeon]